FGVSLNQERKDTRMIRIRYAGEQRNQSYTFLGNYARCCQSLNPSFPGSKTKSPSFPDPRKKNNTLISTTPTQLLKKVTSKSARSYFHTHLLYLKYLLAKHEYRQRNHCHAYVSETTYIL